MKRKKNNINLVEGPVRSFPLDLLRIIGDRQAYILQHAYYILVTKSGKCMEADGRRWFYHRMAQWESDFAMYLSQKTLERHLLTLEKMGLLLSRSDLNKMSMDRTKWYSVDHEKVAELMADNQTKYPVQSDKMSAPRGRQNVCLSLKDVKDVKEETRENSPSARSSLASPSSPRKTATATSSPPVSRTPPKPTDLNKQMREKVRKRMKKHLTRSDVITFWKTLISEYGGQRKVLSFNAKERGMLNNLIKQLKGGGVEIDAFLEYAVSQWNVMAREIKDENGRKRLRPNVTFEQVFWNREDILSHMEKGGLSRAGKPKAGKVTYTKISEVPKDHSNREMLIALIKAQGKVTVST